MYQLYKPTADLYCLRSGNKRTRWLPTISATLKAPLNMPAGEIINFEQMLIYEGPTIPTITSHPEFFI